MLGCLDDERATELLVQLIADSRPSIRFHAAYALGKSKHPAAIDSLVKLLADDTVHVVLGFKRVCDAAVEALSEFGESAALGPLTAALQNENPVIQKNAAAALRKTSDKMNALTNAKQQLDAASNSDLE